MSEGRACRSLDTTRAVKVRVVRGAEKGVSVVGHDEGGQRGRAGNDEDEGESGDAGRGGGGGLEGRIGASGAALSDRARGADAESAAAPQVWIAVP